MEASRGTGHAYGTIGNKRQQELRNVVRLGKVIAFVCGCLSLILLIIAIATTAWLETEGYRQGLWEECQDLEDGTLECLKNADKEWITACASMSIIAMIFNIAAVVFIGIGLVTKNPKSKKNSYLIAMIILFIAIVVLVIGLIVFPAMFVEELPVRSEMSDQWYFGWSYGVGWGAAIFMFGSAILLLVDRESDTIYYREKTYYNGPQSDA